MKWIVLLILALHLNGGGGAQPNFLIILTDDFGYGDLNQPGVDTPNLEWLRANSIEFTQAYAADAVCTPSRAAFLTGRYPIRSGLANDFNRTFYGPGQNGGIPRWVLKFPQLFKAHGYTTALTGKWHLGINREHREDGYFLPTNNGFDYYYGLPMGNTFMCDPENQDPTGCFLYENTTIIEQPIRTKTIAERLLNKTLNYIQTLPRPFMIHYWTIHTHTPLYPQKSGLSPRGTYGDIMMELDAQIGQLLSAVPPNTYIIFTSDNGPYMEEQPNNGSPGLLTGGKGQVFEGGIRVPFLFYHPELPPYRNHHVISLMDVFPTTLELANIPLPAVQLDGDSLVPFLYGNHIGIDRFLVHYCGETPIAVRYGEFKIFYAEQVWSDARAQTCPETIIPVLPYGACGCTIDSLRSLYPPKIYNINLDPQEKFPLNSYEYMEVIETASSLLEQHKQSVIPVKNQLDSPLNDTLAPCCNYPQCFCVEN